MSELSDAFEKIVKSIMQDAGQPKSTMDQPAPADSKTKGRSEAQPGSGPSIRIGASGMKADWTSVILFALFLGFAFAMSWLFYAN
jgi:hypothetical protein